MGRALVGGRQYTLVIDQAWRDAGGLPLTAKYRRTFRATPEDRQPLDPARWRIAAPSAGFLAIFDTFVSSWLEVSISGRPDS